MSYTVRIPLEDLPPCSKLWPEEDVLAFAESVVREAMRRSYERMHGEIESWLMTGDCPDSVSGILGGWKETR